MNYRFTIAATLVLAAFAAAVVAGLPPVTAPKGETPPESESNRVAYTMLGMNVNRTAGDSEARLASGPPEGDRLALDLLMKRTADVRTPMPSNLPGQLASLDAFSKLSPEEMRTVVPELLELLRNRDPIQGARGLQIRHRANLALANIARVYLGQFPVDEADPASPKPAAKAEDLAAQWAAWWAEAASLDVAGQEALSKRLRQGHYDRTDLTTFLANTTFAVNQGDPTPTMLVAQWLDEATPEARESPDGQKLLGLLGKLSALPDAPAEGLLTLYNMVTEIGPIEIGNRPVNQDLQTRMQTVCNLLQQALKVGADWREHRMLDQEEREARGGVYYILQVRPEALAAWETAILRRMEAQAAKSSPPAPPAVGEAKDIDLEHDVPLTE